MQSPSRLFYVPFLGFAAGVGWATLADSSLVLALWLALLAFGLGVVWRRRSFTPPAPIVLGLSLALFGLALGVARLEVASWQFEQSPLAEQVGEAITLTGVVVREPEYRERSLLLTLAHEEVLLRVSTDRQHQIAYGDTLEVRGELATPETFVTDLGREFDYPGYLKAKGITYQISFADVEVVESGGGNLLLAGLLSFKESFMGQLERNIPEPAVGLGEGLLLGVKRALGEDIETAFRQTGLIHIVVLSGYNVMLVVAFTLFCLSYVLPRRPRIVVGLLAVTAFAFLVGLSATVVRASIMASLVLIAQYLGRGYHVTRALVFAGVVMIALNPYILIYDIGFQLSFLATLGLILIAPQFETIIGRSGLTSVSAFVAATIATQIAVLPLLLYHIGEVSVIAVLANVLVLPLVPFAMLLTFFVGLAGYLSTGLALVLAAFATPILSLIIFIATTLAAVPFSTVVVPPFSAWFILPLYLLIGGGWYWWSQRSRGPRQIDTLQRERPVGASAPTGRSDVPKAFR